MNANNPSIWQMTGCPQPPAFELHFDALVDRFDWLQRMRGCMQDPHWHAEGNVLTHVGLVAHELVGRQNGARYPRRAGTSSSPRRCFTTWPNRSSRAKKTAAFARAACGSRRARRPPHSDGGRRL